MREIGSRTLFPGTLRKGDIGGHMKHHISEHFFYYDHQSTRISPNPGDPRKISHPSPAQFAPRAASIRRGVKPVARPPQGAGRSLIQPQLAREGASTHHHHVAPVGWRH
ncbi:unnamed protein product [Prorocentrum cordatum]|uniref:Uncharacterized protein n=1 Tax=Prorocentrum cordatum TaxID=2364126 RepID=A0ABN9RPC1_9DINO|nr:unnamed protein product [Polarella glacialis]